MVREPTAHPVRARTGTAATVVLAIVLAILAIALIAGGAWLAALGGTWFYILAGVILLVVALLLARRSAAALWLQAILIVVTALWALSENRLEWWPLAARLDVFFIIGLVMLAPVFTRNLARPGSGRAALGAVIALCVVLALASVAKDEHRVSGTLATGPASEASLDAGAASMPAGEWQAYGRTGYGQRYSPLTQITPANVGRLQVAWHVHTGDVRGKPGDPEETTDEATPLAIGGRLYFCTPHQFVIALDETTGREIWRFDPHLEPALALQHMTCRGLSYLPPGAAAGGGGVAPAASAVLGEAASAVSVAAATTPPSTTGGASSPVSREAAAVDGTPGKPAPTRRPLPIAAQAGRSVATCDAMLYLATADGRVIALDPATGAVCSSFGGGAGQVDLWTNMPDLLPGSYYSTSPVVVTTTLRRNLVVVGGTVLDNYSVHEASGAIRAYDARSGALVWNWDPGRPDATAPLPAGRSYTENSPNTWSIASVDEALGMVYLPMGNQPPDQWGGHRPPATERSSSSVVALDLATGRERWIFQTVHHDLWDYDVPSQPSLLDLTINGATVPALVQPTKQGELFVLDRRDGRPLLPVQERPAPQGAAAGDRTAPTQPRSALSFDPPRFTGASMWGGTIFDQLACRIEFRRLRYAGRFTPPSVQGSLIYPGNFGVFNWGGVAVDPVRQTVFATPTYLAFVSTLVPRRDATSLMVQADGPPKGALPALNENFGAPFAVMLKPFLSPLGVPCQAPPWGYVAGADLRTGRVAWMHRNGTVRDLSPIPIPLRMGVPNLGGPLLTAGGVAFLSGSMDDYVRAYDAADGRQLWQSRLPAGGQATPMTYTGSDGREYLVVMAGGHGSTHTKPGDDVIAYALPRQ